MPWSCALLALALTFYLVCVAQGWTNLIDNGNGFRQAQTAISAEYMVGWPWKLAYETPVVGPPWSIPFEFPLYQWLMALVVSACPLSMDQAGRLLSVGFFLATLWPLYAIFGALNVSGPHRLLVLALVLFSPFYVFFSRAVLIESTALFLSMGYLALSMHFWKGPRTWLGAVAAAVGGVAAMVKITTFFGFLLAWGAFLLVHGWQAWRRRSSVRVGARVRWALLTLTIAVPIVCSLAWTRFTDQVKEQNELGHYLTSRALWTWNFGTWEMRTSGWFWLAIFRDWGGAAAGDAWVAVAAAIAVLLARRRRVAALSCLVLYLAPPLVFAGVFRHEYYGFANVIFLLAALGLCFTALWERGGGFARAGYAGLAVTLLLMGIRYHDSYYPRQVQKINEFGVAHAATLRLCEFIRHATRPEDIIVIVGHDWSSVIPYYSRRRALALPEWVPEVTLDQMPRYLRHAGAYRIGALILRPRSRFYSDKRGLQQLRELAKLGPQPVSPDGINEVYLPVDRQPTP